MFGDYSLPVAFSPLGCDSKWPHRDYLEGQGDLTSS